MLIENDNIENVEQGLKTLFLNPANKVKLIDLVLTLALSKEILETDNVISKVLNANGKPSYENLLQAMVDQLEDLFDNINFLRLSIEDVMTYGMHGLNDLKEKYSYRKQYFAKDSLLVHYFELKLKFSEFEYVKLFDIYAKIDSFDIYNLPAKERGHHPYPSINSIIDDFTNNFIKNFDKIINYIPTLRKVIMQSL
mmetsp:Transcript_13901/g.11872  ORF Transcript_13901/g.11872 Transcript_13901/m.11872 type:complete len:196 (+) Transcript_13901:1390-1977(+)|eukprot:CAMPEP_0114576154 /NCGR_PEP_ID=MMETSP0125-20121206/941_1 /TAXON_ID=485358 ORGANISM="Aristerostoma sp., Strain ATCC 50986" /NCGR_SAMPLE_ID=MMETSP0125 /ASSEMBLY_ACC=CAM_ASM_000245 /LENGTH=195 /DNA_ID=CAMNT_0001764435 /DNA_START=3293 /DNA_END=3880 /DNA_ORIENTATION=-